MHRLLAPALSLALFACSGDSEDPTGSSTEDSVAVELTVEDGDIPGVMIATVTTSVESTVSLEVGVGGSVQTLTGDSDTEHRFVVLGLKTGSDYDFAASASASGGATGSDSVTARTQSTIDEVPTFKVTTDDADQACAPDGYLLLTWVQGGNSGVAIVDGEGDVVWSVPLLGIEAQVSRSRVMDDGSGIVYTTADGIRRDLEGEVIVQPIDGAAPIVTSTPTSHHDVVSLPDGRVGWLGYSFGSYTCEGGGVLDNAAVDTIEEAEPGGSLTGIYDMFTDYPNPMDCEAGSGFFLPGRYDLSHSNSLMYRASDDSYFHMLRWHDALVKVDRGTGAFEWQLGGLYDDFSPADGQNPEALFSHAHMSDIWDGGLLVFDNNDPGPSWVREYVLDETARTWEQTWAWNTGVFEVLLGDVRRMAGEECSDRVLVTQSTSGAVREVLQDAEGTTVWMLESEVDNTIITRVEYIPDLYDLTSAKLPATR